MLNIGLIHVALVAMKKVTKKEIQSKVEASVAQVIESLEIEKASKKTTKAVKKSSRKLAGKLKKELKKLSRKAAGEKKEKSAKKKKVKEVPAPTLN